MSLTTFDSLVNDWGRLQLSLVTAAGLAVVIHFWAGAFRSNKSRQEPPPLTKNVGLFQTIAEITGGRMRDFLIEQFQKVGGIYRLPFPSFAPMVVVVANTQDARAIYKDPAHTKPPVMYGAIDEFSSGPNIVTTRGVPGDSWYHRRKAINPAFAPKIVHRMNRVALEKAGKWIADTLAPLVGKDNMPPKPFNVGRETILLTIAVICKAAFDYDISDTEREEVRLSMQKGIEEFTIKTMINPLRRVGTWCLPDRREAYQAVAKLKTFAVKIMELYRKNPSPTPDTVIDVIMKNPNYKDDSERIPDIVMMLFAGHDTTGYTMAFALLELAKSPNEQQKLRDELINSKDEGASPPYLKAVLNETMRLHPTSPLTGIKELGSDFASKDGYLVPKGSIIFIAQIALARDAILFPDAFQFQPSRWLEGNVTEDAKQALFPFSLGKRNCVGQPLVNAQLNSVLPLLIRQFEFTVEDEGQIVTQGTTRLDNCYLKATKIAEWSWNESTFD
ncbi:Psoralen synthase (Fragment) [Seminavis robusta]|uniref:Psoralen synthase n=1 Tax=Seminavis robusta TaxID=568900 RepID=A0A9N8HJZ8_9STRA